MRTFPVRVLVVDDSAYLRKVIQDMLARSPQIEVIGTARNGLDALEKVTELNPDVITLDLFMPEMDGVQFLKEQMSRQPLPVVVCSIATEGGENVLAAIESGAVEFIRKPTALALEQVYELADELVEKVLAAANILPEKLPSIMDWSQAPTSLNPIVASGAIEAILIGVSTGGPQALRYLLPKFPANFPVSLAIVLHMPIGYTGPLAESLNQHSQLEVVEAAPGMVMRPGRAILAQAGLHLGLRQVREQVVVQLSPNLATSLYCPSVDFLFKTASEVYGSHSLGVVLTGMGNDGTEGAAWIKAQGGLVYTEAEQTCIVYGMPRAVVEAGLSDQVIPLDRMVEAIMEAI